MLKTESLIDIARESSADQHKCAAAVYDKRGRLLATGVNQPHKSHTLQAKYAKKAGQGKRIYLHAELSALIRCKSDPRTLQIVRIGPRTNLKPSFPCKICMLAIMDAGVSRIVYLNKNFEWEEYELP